jgi:DivIVA domain-containing protein
VTWFLGVLIVVVVGGAVVVALGRGGRMRPVYDDRPDALLPADGELGGSAVRSVRFSVGFRGYRMDEVDALLARLAEQLDQQLDQQSDQERDGRQRP